MCLIIYAVNLFSSNAKFKKDISIVITALLLGLNYLLSVAILMEPTFNRALTTFSIICGSSIIIVFTYINIYSAKQQKRMMMHLIGNGVVYISVIIFEIILFINKYVL